RRPPVPVQRPDPRDRGGPGGMGMMQRIGDYLERAFATGPALVDPGMAAFGIGAETYQPAKYADYPAISNAVYACIRVRATAASSLPIKLYSVDTQGKRTEVETA